MCDFEFTDGSYRDELRNVLNSEWHCEIELGQDQMRSYPQTHRPHGVDLR